MSSQEVSYRTEAMRRRLSSRCEGLLEVTWSADTSSSIVRYLHRTVKDYLRQADIWRHIISGAEPFNPDLILARTFLPAVKVMTLTRDTFDTFWRYFDLRVVHSRSLDSTDTQLKLVDELKRTGDALFASQVLPPALSHWTGTRRTSFRRKYSIEFDYEPYLSFFIFAFRYPLHSYVQRELAAGQPVDSPIFRGDVHRSMLADAARHLDLRMLNILFDAGADPNHCNDRDWTPWQEVLDLWNVGR